MRTLGCVVVVIGLWSVHTECVAQEARDATEVGTTEASREDAAAADAEARARFNAGQMAFDAARFEDALEDFQRAYALSQRPALLYNIGLAAYRARQDALAIESFERFLEHQPNHDNAEQARGRLRTLRSQQTADDDRDREDAPPRPPQSNVDPSIGPAETTSGSNVGAWALGIGGGAAVIGGSVLLAIALSTKGDVESQTSPEWVDIEGDVDSVPRRSGAGIALLAVGGAAVVGAILWKVMAPDSDVAVSVGTDRVVVEGQF